MKKIILGIIVLLLFNFGVYASQQNITLNGNETKYIDPYVIKNETNKKLFIPYTDINDYILGNINGDIEKIDPSNGVKIGISNFMDSDKKYFEIGNKLGGKFYKGGFSIKDATYSWNSSYGSCSARYCGSGTKQGVISCKRVDNDFSLGNEQYCDVLGGAKPSSYLACTAAQSTCISSCNYYSVGKYRSDGKRCSRLSYTSTFSYDCSYTTRESFQLCAVTGAYNPDYCTTYYYYKTVSKTCYGTRTYYYYGFR